MQSDQAGLLLRESFMNVNMGMRISEIAGLRWPCIDFKKCEITVGAQLLLDRGKGSPKGLSTPKGNRPRKFVASLSVMNCLKNVKRKQLARKLLAGELWSNPDDLMFTNEDRKSTRLNSSHPTTSRMPSSA